MKTCAAIGTFAMVPQLFVYWAFVTTPTVTLAVLNSYFWRGLVSGCFAWMGVGVLCVASLAYLAESF